MVFQKVVEVRRVEIFLEGRNFDRWIWIGALTDSVIDGLETGRPGLKNSCLFSEIFLPI